MPRKKGFKHSKETIEENNIKTLIDAVNCNELWFITNGITLCVNCHKIIHKKIIKR